MIQIHKCLHDDLLRDGRTPDPAERKRLSAHVAEVAEMLATYGLAGALVRVSRPDRTMRIDEVLHLAGVSYATLWRWERAGKFPRRRKLNGARAVGWKESEVKAWLKGR